MGLSLIRLCRKVDETNRNEKVVAIFIYCIKAGVQNLLMSLHALRRALKARLQSLRQVRLKV